MCFSDGLLERVVLGKCLLNGLVEDQVLSEPF